MPPVCCVNRKPGMRYAFFCGEEVSSLATAGKCASFATHLSGPFLPATPSLAEQQQQKPLLRGSARSRPQATPQSSALRLCRPPLRYAPSTPLIAPFQGWGTPPLALAAPAGVGQGQGVFVSKHSTAIQKRRNYPMSSTTANPYRISLTEMLKQEGRTFEAMAEEVMFGDANALALCTEHCEVEPDGTCPHGCPSFMRAAGLI